MRKIYISDVYDLNAEEKKRHHDYAMAVVSGIYPDVSEAKTVSECHIAVFDSGWRSFQRCRSDHSAAVDCGCLIVEL